jgi:VWFA-related protein
MNNGSCPMKWSSAVAACIALLGPSATARAPAAAPQAVTSFKAGVELVRLDVRVTDDEGRPVRDIKQDEVEIVENGEKRPVVFFQHVAEPAESFADIASHTVASEVSTNQGAARGHLYVLVFDQQHLTPGSEQRVRQAAQTFVGTRLRPGDRVALYAVPGPGPQIGFTSDARRLAAELVKVRGMAQPQVFGALGPMSVQEAFQIVRGDEQTLRRVTDRMQALVGASDAQQRSDPAGLGTAATPLADLVKDDALKIADIADGETRRVLAMMADILRPMRAIEGRKSVVFISEGFYGDRLSREIEDVAAAAAESYSVIDALDMNRREADITADEPGGADQASAIQDRLAPLGGLAAETDGRLLVDAAHRTDQIFTALADESQDYYLVGFVPGAATARDRGSYRRVTVGVRRGHTRVSTRTGFTLADHDVKLTRRQAIDRAFTAPYPLQALPIQFTTYQLRGSSSGMQRVIVSLAADLPIASSTVSAPADVAFVVRAATDGHVAASGTDIVPLPQRQRDTASSGTGAYHVQFELPAGEYLMRVVVREPGGLVGSADRRFEVRALDGPSIESGDLVLSSTRGDLPVRPAAYVGDGLSGMLELYGRTSEQLDAPHVTVDLVPLGETTAVVSGAAELDPVRIVSNGVARAARVALPLDGIAPGTYLARARAMVGPDTVAQVVREVDIRQGRRPADDADGPQAEAFDPHEIVNGTLVREYSASIARHPSDAAAYAGRGIERFGAADYPAAIAAFQSSLDAPGANAVSAFLLGWAYHAAGDDRQAISAWRRAVYMDPAIIPAQLALADLYVRLSQPALAVQALRAGLKAVPQSTELLERLSSLESRR